MNKKKLIALNCTEANGMLYFVNSELNMLYAINRVNGNIQFTKKIPEEDFEGKYLFGNIVVCNKRLILVPLYARKVWIFNLIKETWEAIELPNEVENIEGKFFGAIPYGSKVFLLGHKYPGVAIVDVEKNDITFKLSSEIAAETVYMKDGYLNWDYIIRDNYLLTPILCKNAVLKIDLMSNQIEEIIVGDTDCKYVGISYDGNNYWLAPRIGKKFVKWDGEDKVETYLLPDDYSMDKYCFGGSFICANRVYFTSFTGLTYTFDFRNPTKGSVIKQRITFYSKIDANEFLIQNDEGDLYLIKDNEGEVAFDYNYDEGLFEDYIYENHYMSKNEGIKENDLFKLSSFLRVVVKS